MKHVVVPALVAWLVAWAAPVFAQQSIDLASVSGRVTDASGAVVPDADVTARHVETNVIAAITTDAEGRFRFPYLKVGPYEIRVKRAGFAEASHMVTLTTGGAFELPVSLTVSSVDTTVTVTGVTTMLEAARTQIAGTVSQTEVRNLPLNGRNFLELALLVPGVSPTNVASTQLFAETSAVPGITLSVGSQRNLSNSFIVDGLSANDDAAGLSGITYGVDAIEEFQVVTSGGQAELGRALGGYINIVTRSGTNVMRGDLYAYGRDDRLNGRNALSGTKLPMTQSQYGASLGGPIVANRTFHFTNVERRRLDQSGLATISAASTDAINRRLNETGYQGPPVATGVYKNPVHSTNLLTKVNHEVSGRDQFTIRYSLYDVTSEHSRGAGGLNAPSASSGLRNRDHAVAMSNTFMISGRTVLETRAQFARGDLNAPPTDPIGPAVSIAGVASFGTSSGSPTRRFNKLYQAVNNVSHQAGSHALKGGIDFLYNDDRITYPRSVRGSYSFSSMQNFLAGVYNNAGFTQTFGVSEVKQTNPNVGVYAQDEWKAGRGITLNLGVRYDLQFLETIHTDINNVSPRVGLAWSPFESRRTLVRGSAGLFYDRVPLRPLANALLSAGNTSDIRNLRQISVTLSPAQVGAPAFPNTLSSVIPSVTLVNLTTMDPDLQNAYSRQASAEIEQQLTATSAMSIGYQYLRGSALLIAVNQNVPSCIPAGTNNGCRPNPEYANNNQYSSVGDSNYHALHLSWLQRPARWGHYRISYTLSKSMNNVGEFFFSQPIDPLDLSKDWGRSDDDQRHRLVVNGTLTARGFQVSGMLQAYSALPFNITSGETTLQGTPGRPIENGSFIERNAGAGSGFFAVSARISRSFRVSERIRLEAIAEGFNLTNRRNVLTRNTNFGPGAYPGSPSATFAQITGVGDPRAFQVGVRVRF